MQGVGTVGEADTAAARLAGAGRRKVSRMPVGTAAAPPAPGQGRPGRQSLNTKRGSQVARPGKDSSTASATICRLTNGTMPR